MVASLVCCLAWLACAATNEIRLDPGAAFDAANRLYEQGKYLEAITAYEGLLQQGIRAPAVWFNLGTAYYKAGQNGRAIAAFLAAERLDPRDASLQANLGFVREKVAEQLGRQPFPWGRALHALSLGEWVGAALFCFWLTFGVLIVRELAPRYSRLLMRGAWISGVLCALLSAGATAATYAQYGKPRGVIVGSEANVRLGPVAESEVAFQLPDGAEVKVEELRDGWAWIQAPDGRLGWVLRTQLLPTNIW